MSKEDVLKIQVSSSLLCFLSTQDIPPHVPSCFCRHEIFVRLLACLLLCLIRACCPCVFVCSSPNPQTCVLKVNIHCDGCQKKVKKILSKNDGK